IWLYLSTARAGHDGRAGLEKNMPRVNSGKMWEKFISLYLGNMSPEEVLQAAEGSDPKERKERVCEARFYIGEHALLQGRKSEAAKFFKAAFESCPFEFVEYPAARAELEWLEK
ncbi:MAG TPA: hypothetical protein VKH64_11130, partial [Candidatus Binatia bacterium]|nr:hypothetical protein [Candidatus Binatia bacterium]